MSKQLFFILFFTSVLTTFAQEKLELHFHSELEEKFITQYESDERENLFSLYLIADESLSEDNLFTNKALVADWVIHFEKKKRKYRNDKSFLSHVFYKIHRKILKNYKQYSTFNETLLNSDYDCLSATTLYASLLSGLDFDFKIIETNYHIYLNVAVDNGDFVLLESTDPINGFIESEKEINERLTAYVKANSATTSSEGEYAFKESIHSSIEPDELVGLQYYNASIKAFNDGDLYTATTLLEKGVIFYHSSRFEELGMVIAQTLLADDTMNNDIKKSLLAKIPFIKNGNKEVVLISN